MNITDEEFRTLICLQATLSSVHNDVINKLIDHYDDTRELYWRSVEDKFPTELLDRNILIDFGDGLVCTGYCHLVTSKFIPDDNSIKDNAVRWMPLPPTTGE
jgi:hypothetical protein